MESKNDRIHCDNSNSNYISKTEFKPKVFDKKTGRKTKKYNSIDVRKAIRKEPRRR